MGKLIGKLLVLDDEQNAQKQLEQLLSGFGLAFSFVSQKTEVLQVLKGGHKNYDLLLVNSSEPKYHDVAKLIRDDSKTFGFVNIIYYGDKFPNYLSKYVDCFMLDAFDNDSLYKNISRFLIVSENGSEEHDGLFCAFENYTRENKILMYRTIVKSMSQDVELLSVSVVDNKKLGHKIKGTSEMIGAEKLGYLSKNFEVSHCSSEVNDLKKEIIKEILNVVEYANNSLENLINEK